jgi:ankyrin repeat protein
MENEISNQEIFNLIKKKKFTDLFNLIKSKKIKNFDIKDDNYNFLIQYIINYNLEDVLSLIVERAMDKNTNFRIDILDTDGRSILYNCIKYNYVNLIKILLKYNSSNIGIPIIDIKDKLGLTALHYSVIFNNFDSFKILLDYDADPYLNNNEGYNVFITALVYKRNNMLEYLLNKNYDLHFVNNNGETILQVAVSYQNNLIINILLTKDIEFNNINTEFGLSVLHQSIINNNFDLFKKLLAKKDIDYNLPDFYGNTPLHYILMDGYYNYLEPLFEKSEIKFNVSNLNGEIPLHILLESDNFNTISSKILNKIILESDLNLQNNNGVSCLMLIIRNELLSKFKSIIQLKPLNVFIQDNNNQQIELNNEIIEVLVNSYYNQIKINKEELLVDWEKWCSIDNYDKLKNIIKHKSGLNNSESICKEKIKEVILGEKRSIPKLTNIDITFDNGIFVDNCFYTGSPIDILFGLYFLYQKFSSSGLSLILDYPLSVNLNLEKYYQKLGLAYPYKLDFSNIEIIWSYQKMFLPTYFDEVIINYKNSKYIVIPIGIETSKGAHANILFWDVGNKTIERFEPNGANYPLSLNYNPKLLDNMLEERFKYIDNEIKYLRPKDFLPPIGFQLLESLETSKCKRISDPNGFCGVWCIWWIYQRMNNIKIEGWKLATEIIKQIKFDNQSFKTIIRNFSKNITDIRDSFLSKQKLDINDWIVGNYTEEQLTILEKDIFNKLMN